jgi:hypothetical protein
MEKQGEIVSKFKKPVPEVKEEGILSVNGS